MLKNLPTWLDYFSRNAQAPCTIPWKDKDILSITEKDRIAKSIATFQLGENSEGRHLIQRATEVGRSHQRPELKNITALFIAEEQNHAALLERFMTSHKIPIKQKDWTDGIFRKLRHLVNYEMMVSVLITAELIALGYYRALKNQTGSLVLRCICQKILCDERAHVEFESSILRRYHRQESWILASGLRQGHKLLYGGATLVVYLEHRKVLTAGGYNLKGFWQACWHQYQIYLGAARLPQKRYNMRASENIADQATKST